LKEKVTKLWSEENRRHKKDRKMRRRKKEEVGSLFGGGEGGPRNGLKEMEEVEIKERVVRKHVITLQRQWRLRAVSRGLRRLYLFLYKVVVVQRVWRGVVGRRKFSSLQTLWNLSSSTIQQAWKAYLARKMIRMWQESVKKAMDTLLPLFRTFVHKILTTSLVRYHRSAIQIQVPSFLFSCQYLMMWL